MARASAHLDAENGSAEQAIANIICNLNMLLSPEQVAAINWHPGQSVSVAVMRLIDKQQTAINAVWAREYPNMVPAHLSRASELRHQTISQLLTLAVERGRVREAIQRAYLAGYKAGRNRVARREARGEAA